MVPPSGRVSGGKKNMATRSSCSTLCGKWGKSRAFCERQGVGWEASWKRGKEDGGCLVGCPPRRKSTALVSIKQKAATPSLAPFSSHWTSLGREGNRRDGEAERDRHSPASPSSSETVWVRFGNGLWQRVLKRNGCKWICVCAVAVAVKTLGIVPRRASAAVSCADGREGPESRPRLRFQTFYNLTFGSFLLSLLRLFYNWAVWLHCSTLLHVPRRGSCVVTSMLMWSITPGLAKYLGCVTNDILNQRSPNFFVTKNGRRKGPL